MVPVRQLLRLLVIQWVLIRHGLDEVILATHLFRPIRFLLYLLPWNWFRRRYAPRGVRIRNAMEDLGPMYVKLGQLLSTRRDLIPDDIAEELSKLQDSVPPFPGVQARQIIEATYGHPVGEVFSEFDQTPLASASIAQVHAARLRDGRQVVVKVVRPGIRKRIQRDLGLVQILAALAERYWVEGRRLRPLRVVAEYERIILDELDLIREAANASQLRRNLAGSPDVYVPSVEWDLTRDNLLVMERVSGISIDNLEALYGAGIDVKKVAEIAVQMFFTQVFRDRFFHADLHPGNLFVVAEPGGQPLKLVPVDFGIMGSLSELDQRYLANNFMAFLKRDYRRVAELHVESAWVPPGTRVEEFELAIRTVCEPMFEKPVKDISFGHLLLRLFQTAQRFRMEVLPQLLLLQKTLVNVEGVARQLHPDLDIWHSAQPLLERWMSERVGVRRLIGEARDSLPLWAERLPGLPGHIVDLVEQIKKGELSLHARVDDLEALRHELRSGTDRKVYAILAAAAILSASLLFGLHERQLSMLGDAPFIVWVLGGFALLLLGGAFRVR